jgi:hypothetical protein
MLSRRSVFATQAQFLLYRPFQMLHRLGAYYRA